MRNLSRLIGLVVLTVSAALTQAASEVIELNYRMAQDVLPVVQSVLGDSGRATAYGNQLIINASHDKIAEVRSI